MVSACTHARTHTHTHTSNSLPPLSSSVVVVVVDSDNFPHEVRNVAELLYDLLLERDVWRGRVPLLVACNKQDMSLARDSAAVRRQLEKEM